MRMITRVKLRVSRYAFRNRPTATRNPQRATRNARRATRNSRVPHHAAVEHLGKLPLCVAYVLVDVRPHRLARGLRLTLLERLVDPLARLQDRAAAAGRVPDSDHHAI